MLVLVGIVGKPNVGKSTFFASATLRSVPIADYPFTTIKPNVGMGYLRTKCVCKEMGVEDNPKNSVCIDGVRLIPVKLVDVAGLVEGASVGRGLGNQFLDDLRQADALIHVVDASGSTDDEGRKVGPGTHDPSGDIEMVEKELDLWILGIVEKDWEKAARIAEQTGGNIVQHLASRLTGLAIDEETIEAALLHFKLKREKPTAWSDGDLRTLVKWLREKTLPSLIAANKADLPTSKPNIEKLKSGERTVIPCASEAELLLRKAAEQGLIRYTPGSNSFDVLKRDGMTPAQSRALDLVHERVLRVWGDTGVQQAIDQAYFGLLKAIVVFPVEDESKLSDKNGKVLPDAHVMKGGTTALDLARRIHSELAESFLYAIDGRSGKRLADDYGLKNGDIIKIVSSGRRS
ncbi:MAG: redox-regulated ATPase YchF [Thaumarchaeota archaeon]|nr:redox-regulated ATPase YchF [Nitrososphaerota archaeon]